MCVRTKTSYGCGHVFKATNDCYHSDCSGMDKYHYLKNWDCRDCKRGGSDISRGKDGQGRYAQKLQKARSKPRDRTASSSDESLPAEHDVSGGASPWAPEARPEKTWETPHRKQADEAWLSEHDDRISDLQERLGRAKLSGGRSRPNKTTEIVLASEDYDSDEYDLGDYDQVEITPSRKPVKIDTRRHLSRRTESPRSGGHQDRQYSHDSLPDSMPSYRSSPRIRQASTVRVVDAHPHTTHEYDYYNSSSGHSPSKHQYKRHLHTPSRSKSDSHQVRRTHPPELDYRVVPAPPPLHMPPPAQPIYDTYDYYSPSASPGAPYTFSEYPYGSRHVRPQHYVPYPRY